MGVSIIINNSSEYIYIHYYRIIISSVTMKSFQKGSNHLTTRIELVRE